MLLMEVAPEFLAFFWKTRASQTLLFGQAASELSEFAKSGKSIATMTSVATDG